MDASPSEMTPQPMCRRSMHIRSPRPCTIKEYYDLLALGTVVGLALKTATAKGGFDGANGRWCQIACKKPCEIFLQGHKTVRLQYHA
jgi:hypothetical protein